MADMQKDCPSIDIIRGVMTSTRLKIFGISMAKQVFNAPFVNIQSTSGTVSNIATLKALAKPGDDITAVSTADGGHISHARMGAVGLRDLNLHTYPWVEERMEPDIDGACALIQDVKPKVVLIGQSVYLFPTPLEDIAQTAHDVGATVVYDAAHVLGLIAGGVFQDPLREGADVMTGSSHKTSPDHKVVSLSHQVRMPVSKAFE